MKFLEMSELNLLKTDLFSLPVELHIIPKVQTERESVCQGPLHPPLYCGAG